MRYLLSLILLSNFLFALISEPVHSKISSISEEGIISIKPLKEAQVGMYGVIVQHFNDKRSTALSWVEVTKILDNRIDLKSIPIHALEQSALPTGTWSPKIGDEVILGYNYHRSLLISPNASVYKKVTGQYKKRHWVHPDIFTTVLSSNGHPTPLKEDFRHTCRTNNIGLVSFVLDESLITIDCQSFKIMKNKGTSIETGEVQLPFYSRVEKIEANWFGEGSGELREYTPYYIGLLAKNNPDNEWIQNYKTTQSEKDSSTETKEK